MTLVIPATLAQFNDLVSEDIQNIYVKRAELPTKMEKYFNVDTTDSYYDKDSSVLGASKAKFIDDNASVLYDAPLQGFDKTLNMGIRQVPMNA